MTRGEGSRHRWRRVRRNTKASALNTRERKREEVGSIGPTTLGAEAAVALAAAGGVEEKNGRAAAPLSVDSVLIACCCAVASAAAAAAATALLLCALLLSCSAWSSTIMS